VSSPHSSVKRTCAKSKAIVQHPRWLRATMAERNRYSVGSEGPTRHVSEYSSSRVSMVRTTGWWCLVSVGELATWQPRYTRGMMRRNRTGFLERYMDTVCCAIPASQAASPRPAAAPTESRSTPSEWRPGSFAGTASRRCGWRAERRCCCLGRRPNLAVAKGRGVRTYAIHALRDEQPTAAAP
jgi:hypothetical protein